MRAMCSSHTDAQSPRHVVRVGRHRAPRDHPRAVPADVVVHAEQAAAVVAIVRVAIVGEVDRDDAREVRRPKRGELERREAAVRDAGDVHVAVAPRLRRRATRSPRRRRAARRWCTRRGSRLRTRPCPGCRCGRRGSRRGRGRCRCGAAAAAARPSDTGCSRRRRATDPGCAAADSPAGAYTSAARRMPSRIGISRFLWSRTPGAKSRTALPGIRTSVTGWPGGPPGCCPPDP